MKKTILPAVVLIVLLTMPFEANAREKVFRIGMIGLDTSHVIAFTKLINNSQAEHGCKVVVGYSGGSPDIPSSAGRVENYTNQLRDKYGLEIVDTIEELCEKVDGVLLESVDGRPHLKQAIPVIKARKPLFVDKPMAGNLADVIEIFRLAKENNVPCWSSSSLRYSPAIVELKKNNTAGEILGCDTYGPCSLEEHHPDLYWYGVHAVEMLFTIMGPGCKSVRRVQSDNYEHVVGVWEGGRIGTFRGLKTGKKSYGFTVYGTKGIIQGGKFGGYEPLVTDVIKFFKTGKVPVPAEETIEIFAFMSAADESKAKGGTAVLLPVRIVRNRRTFADGRPVLDGVVYSSSATSRGSNVSEGVAVIRDGSSSSGYEELEISSGSFIAIDRKTGNFVRIRSSMTKAELEDAARAAGVTLRKVSDDRWNCGNIGVIFRDGKLARIRRPPFE